MTLDPAATEPPAPRNRPGGVLLRNGLLALLSVAAGLAACEAALRLFHPRYELAANPPLPGTPSSPAGERAYQIQFHPDTGAAHRVVHNNLGGRQSRDFPAASLDGTVNIAFFGDSLTENLHMPAQYSYTEPLDYLLNTADGKSDSSVLDAPRFQVLNFGVWGAGTGRSYLRWRSLPARRELDHVFYMATNNDFRELREALGSGLVRLGESGELLEGGPPLTPAWKRLLARSHMTYLVLDAWRRFDVRPDPGEPGSGGVRFRRPEMLRVMRALVRRWKAEVEADGGAFHVVLTPGREFWFDAIARDAAPESSAGSAGVVDLLECFKATVPDFRWGDWQFVNDPHWTPAANMLAATCLYRHLERALDLPTRAEEELAQARHAYYRAFMDAPAWQGERYMPTAAWARSARGGAAGARTGREAANGGAIVAKYLALELASAPVPAWLRDAYAAGAVATSAWDVYANARERRLAYVKSPCDAHWRARDPGGGFFLHAVPFTREKLPAHPSGLDFVNLDHGPFSYHHRSMYYHRVAYHRWSADECVFSMRLPDYPLSRVRTGQYAERREGGQTSYEELWSATFRMPLARSAWDVYASADGRGLEYVKAPCRRADTEPRFYLHVYPLRSADRPGAGRAYANRDFAWDAAGAVVDGACRISAALPEFPIAFVHTGQYRDGVISRRLWSVRVDFAEVERLAPAAGDGDA